MIVNISLVTYITIKNTRSSDIYIGKRVNEFIEYYNEHTEEGIEIKLNHMGLQGVLYNLDDLGIENYAINQERVLEHEGYFFNY